MVLTTDISTSSQFPQPAIGFTAIHRGTPQELASSQNALQQVLGYFDDLALQSFEIGETQLVLWGRGDMDRSCHTLPDGSVIFLIGSPHGNNITWEAISESVLQASPSNPFTLPWEGRVILLRIDPKGNSWTLWNDWLGSIPVFHAKTPAGRIASTLEPAIVNALELGNDDFFLPGLLSLLLRGHFFSNWTLFKSIKTVPPDSESRWELDTFQTATRYSVLSTDQRWQAGFEEIREEMYLLSREAIASVLKEQPKWVIPLSSGLDSRLIAGVAAEMGIDVVAYTWGTPRSSDVIHAKSIARALGIPWKYLKPGNTYLSSYRDQWADMFGSAMHFHGMYQMPFLDALKHEQPGNAPIVSGFIGECLTGYDVEFLCEVREGSYPYQVTPDGYLHWTIKELRELMRIPIDDAIAELAAEYERQLEMVPGPLYQKLRFITLWGRQRHFTYFQSIMSDYWRGVATPYMDRKYARFSFSLPRVVLDKRIMQKMMYAHYYPKLASIPGTYAEGPTVPSGSYILKKGIARYLPKLMTSTLFPDLQFARSNSEIACVWNDKKDAFHPLFNKISQLADWMNIEAIDNAYDKIHLENDMQAVRKLQSIQTFAYRLPN